MLEKIKDILELRKFPNDQLRTEIKRIPWDTTFLLEAILWSKRSHDPQTKCGCVLAKNNVLIMAGYNGFISEINDTALPNLRPFKYPFFIHAEHNAILNCARRGVSTAGATAYISGEPCNYCLQYLWQASISRIVYTNYSKPNMVDNEEHKRQQRALLYLMDNRMSFEFIDLSEIKENI